MNGIEILFGDCRETLKTLPDCSVHCVVTSPPYFGLRSYMPNAVRIKASLSHQKQSEIEAELAKLGILPVAHTSE